ncbi:abortive infection family protein [Brevundimonas bullata]|uniref:abortive infection family protein n=1 Tax=Brevundimonas bullata TaxID=13160 RepID=UPI002FDAD611
MSYFQGGQSDVSPEPELDMWLVDEVLGMTQGYVLDFSDKTFNDFVRRTFGIDVTAPIYTVDGTSKAKRMRAFLRALVPGAQAEVLRKFWAYRQRSSTASPPLEPRVESAFFEMVARLEGSSQPIDLGVVEKFNQDETLSELVDAIEREIQANSPHAALDRLHTYTMKKFAELLRADGIEVSQKDSLHGRAGRYINSLRRTGQIGEISDQIAKSATQIFERFNDVRNNSSLAHDNELLGRAEGRYVFEAILSLLRFIKALDEAKFGR